jgi:hypothetical protein
MRRPLGEFSYLLHRNTVALLQHHERKLSKSLVEDTSARKDSRPHPERTSTTRLQPWAHRSEDARCGGQGSRYKAERLAAASTRHGRVSWTGKQSDRLATVLNRWPFPVPWQSCARYIIDLIADRVAKIHPAESLPSQASPPGCRHGLTDFRC